MNTRRLILILIPMAVIAVLALALFQARPRINQVRPEPGATAVPAASAFQITFSEPMDPDTVEARLIFEPSVPGRFSWEENTVSFTPTERWPGSTEISVRLASGARALFLGLPILGDQTWTFSIAAPQLAFLWPSDEPADLYILDPEGGETRQLTETAHGVLDFSISADGVRFFYSAANLAGGSDLYLYDRLEETSTLLLDCGDDRCVSPQFWSSGGLLAYQAQASGPSTSGRTIIWLSPLEGTSLTDPGSIAVLTEPTLAMAWSATGRLIYHDPQEDVFVFYDPLTAETTRLTNLTGAPGAWAPGGQVYLAPEILDASLADPEALTQPSHLIQLNPDVNRSVSLTPGTNTENTDPSFAPNGQLVAFARRYLDPARWTPGRQLWTMAANGGELRQLTKEPIFTHTDFTWRPDGRQIAYTRFNQMTLTDPPEIWVIAPDGSDPLRLVIGGYDPQWIP